MDFRNLTRFYVINKALRMFGKHNGYTLNHGQLSVLIALEVLERKSYDSVRKHLGYFNRGVQMDRIIRYIKGFIALGLVEKRGKYYVLTLAGKNVLCDIERRCRKLRLDR